MFSFFNQILFTYGDQDEKIIRVQALFFILITLVVSILLYKGVKAITKKYMEKNSDSVGRVDSFIQIQKYFFGFIAFLVILNILKFNLTSLIVSASAILVVISFGLQSLFTDFISGIIILFDGTIKSSDIIEVGGTVGKVERITLRNTTLITRDDYTIIMPNKKFITENVTNWSHNNNTMRFHITVGVAYGSDTKLISKLLSKCIDEHSLISKSKKGFVGFKDFGDSALVFELYFLTTEIFRIEIIKSDLRFMIDKSFRDNNISIPFPQRDLHIIPTENPISK